MVACVSLGRGRHTEAGQSSGEATSLHTVRATGEQSWAGEVS